MPYVQTCVRRLGRLSAFAFVLLTMIDLAARGAEAPGRRATQDRPGKSSLKIGDRAPKLHVSRWAKAGPIEELKEGKVHVVAFWATWCGPCTAAMPHLSQLHERYKDEGLVIIGMNVWETDLRKVDPFVEQMGHKLNYAVAVDEYEGEPRVGGGKTAQAWMRAAGENGIPCSFIVDREGRIAWFGTSTAMDGPLEQIIAGTFDADAEAKSREARPEPAIDQAAAERAVADFRAAMDAQAYDKALAALDEFATANPGMADLVATQRLTVLIAKGDYAAANEVAKKLGEQALAKKDGMLALQVAAALASAPESSKVNADLVIKLANGEADAADANRARIARRTLAKAYAAKRDHAKAVELQEKVVAGLAGPALDREQKVLEQYQVAKAAEN